jgi:hypothetical protein
MGSDKGFAVCWWFSGYQYEFCLAAVDVLHALFVKVGVFFEHNTDLFIPLFNEGRRIKLNGVSGLPV